MSNNCIVRNEKEYLGKLNPLVRQRIRNLKKFIGNKKPSIDVGCGAYTPKYLGVTHACDNGEIAKKYLKKVKWKGEFTKCDVGKSLPYPDKFFSVLVCSEVIEHLNSEEEVRTAFREIDRISKSWLVTTPAIVIDDPDHKFWFTGDHLFDIVPFDRKDYIIIKSSIYYYLSKDLKKMHEIFKVKNGG